MSAIDDLIATATARTTTVRVFARGDLVERHAELSAQLYETLPDNDSLADTGPSQEIAQQIEDLQAEMEASTVEITFSTITQHKWANLLLKHTPSAAERRAGHDHDPVTFPIAAVSACAVEPEISPLQADNLYKALHPAEWNKIWVAVWTLNAAATPLPKLAAASELLRASESLATPSALGSPDPSSSDGSGDPSPPTPTDTEAG